jgi:hypothetical protein
MFSSGSAAAHGVGSEAQASNYRSTVDTLNPAVPGLTVRVVEAGNQLELTNRTGDEVLVLGYRFEPFLRIGPAGVFVNQCSPTLTANRTGGDADSAAQVDPAAAPDWRRIGKGPTAAWHDHRAHWHGRQDPAIVRQAPGTSHRSVASWQVPMLMRSAAAGGIYGSISWVPGPSPWPWLLAAVGLFTTVVAASRTRVGEDVLIAAIGFAVTADVVHMWWTASTGPLLAEAAGGSLSIVAWIAAALALIKIVRGNRDAGRVDLLVAGLLLVIAGGIADLSALARSQLPFGLDPQVTRAIVAVILGLGGGMAAAGLWRWLDGLPMRRGRQRRRARRLKSGRGRPASHTGTSKARRA